jgi:hypothetical protein
MFAVLPPIAFIVLALYKPERHGALALARLHVVLLGWNELRRSALSSKRRKEVEL